MKQKLVSITVHTGIGIDGLTPESHTLHFDAVIPMHPGSKPPKGNFKNSKQFKTTPNRLAKNRETSLDASMFRPKKLK